MNTAPAPPRSIALHGIDSYPGSWLSLTLHLDGYLVDAFASWWTAQRIAEEAHKSSLLEKLRSTDAKGLPIRIRA